MIMEIRSISSFIVMKIYKENIVIEE